MNLIFRYHFANGSVLDERCPQGWTEYEAAEHLDGLLGPQVRGSDSEPDVYVSHLLVKDHNRNDRPNIVFVDKLARIEIVNAKEHAATATSPNRRT